MDFSSLHATILQSIVHYWLKIRSKNRTANVGLKFLRVSAHFILDVIAAIKQEWNKSRNLVQANFVDLNTSAENATGPISMSFCFSFV